MNVQNFLFITKSKLLIIGPRIFYLLALIYSIIHIFLWSLIYTPHEIKIKVIGFSSIFVWHAHEMLYGYTMAVIAGFLMVIPKGENYFTKSANTFFLLHCVSWLLARIAPFAEPSIFEALFLFNLIFCFFLFNSIRKKVLANKKNYGPYFLVAFIFLLFFVEILFYVSEFYFYMNSIFLIKISIYIVGLLISIISGRVLSNIIVKDDLPSSQQIHMYKSNSLFNILKNLFKFYIAGLILFFIIISIFSNQFLILIASIAVLIIGAARLIILYKKTIFENMLVAGLYMTNIFILIAVLIKGVEGYFQLIPTLYLHALTFGGIGIATATMMSRIIIGFSGGDSSRKPEKLVSIGIMILILGSIVRAILPIFIKEHYLILVLISEFLWVAGFGMLSVKLIPKLFQAKSLEKKTKKI